MPALDLNSSPAKCEMVATPKDASDSLSGLALAAATSAATSLIGLSRWVTSTIVMVPVWAIGSKSFALSYGTFSFTAFCKVKVEFELENRVYPSGAAMAASLAAIVVPPPGRLSTITGLPRRVSSSPAMMRPTTSEAPPAGKGTINCSCFSGKLPCAVAIDAQPTTQADAIAAVRNIRIMSKQVSCLPCSPAIRAGAFGDSRPGSMEQGSLNRPRDQPYLLGRHRPLQH